VPGIGRNKSKRKQANGRTTQRSVTSDDLKDEVPRTVIETEVFSREPLR
jgi:hypothetical protein